MNFGGEWSEFKVPAQNTLLQLVPILTLDRTGASFAEDSRQNWRSSHDVFRFRFRSPAAAATSTYIPNPDDDAYGDTDVDRMSSKTLGSIDNLLYLKPNKPLSCQVVVESSLDIPAKNKNPLEGIRKIQLSTKDVDFSGLIMRQLKIKAGEVGRRARAAGLDCGGCSVAEELELCVSR